MFLLIVVPPEKNHGLFRGRTFPNLRGKALFRENILQMTLNWQVSAGQRPPSGSSVLAIVVSEELHTLGKAWALGPAPVASSSGRPSSGAGCWQRGAGSGRGSRLLLTSSWDLCFGAKIVNGLNAFPRRTLWARSLFLSLGDCAPVCLQWILKFGVCWGIAVSLEPAVNYHFNRAPF